MPSTRLWVWFHQHVNDLRAAFLQDLRSLIVDGGRFEDAVGVIFDQLDAKGTVNDESVRAAAAAIDEFTYCWAVAAVLAPSLTFPMTIPAYLAADRALLIVAAAVGYYVQVDSSHVPTQEARATTSDRAIVGLVGRRLLRVKSDHETASSGMNVRIMAKPSRVPGSSGQLDVLGLSSLTRFRNAPISTASKPTTTSTALSTGVPAIVESWLEVIRSPIPLPDEEVADAVQGLYFWFVMVREQRAEFMAAVRQTRHQIRVYAKDDPSEIEFQTEGPPVRKLAPTNSFLPKEQLTAFSHLILHGCRLPELSAQQLDDFVKVGLRSWCGGVRQPNQDLADAQDAYKAVWKAANAYSDDDESVGRKSLLSLQHRFRELLKSLGVEPVVPRPLVRFSKADHDQLNELGPRPAPELTVVVDSCEWPGFKALGAGGEMRVNAQVRVKWG